MRIQPFRFDIDCGRRLTVWQERGGKTVVVNLANTGSDEDCAFEVKLLGPGGAELGSALLEPGECAILRRKNVWEVVIECMSDEDGGDGEPPRCKGVGEVATGVGRSIATGRQFAVRCQRGRPRPVVLWDDQSSRSVTAVVHNTGYCSFDLILVGDVLGFPFPVSTGTLLPGESAIVRRDDINRVLVDCNGNDANTGPCGATFEVRIETRHRPLIIKDRQSQTECGRAEPVTIWDDDEDHTVAVSLENQGRPTDCPMTLKLLDASGGTIDSEQLKPGKTARVRGKDVRKVTVECEAGAAPDSVCKSFYTIKVRD